jgi:hypothetical protein
MNIELRTLNLELEDEEEEEPETNFLAAEE